MCMESRTVVITPGSMGATALAIDLFGVDRVIPGEWLGPVYVQDVTPDELKAAVELLGEHGLRAKFITA